MPPAARRTSPTGGRQCLGIWDQTLNEKDKLYLMDIQGYLTRQDNPWKIQGKGRKDRPQVILDYPKRYLEQYADVFSEEDFDKLPPRRPWDHCIELSADFKPVNCKIYALNREEQQALDTFLEENLRSGRVRH